MVPKKLCFLVISLFLDTHCLDFIEKELQKPHLQVHTKSGIIQGTRLKSSNLKNGYYYAFMGIPYGQPPVGDLRFRSPKWVRNWSGVLDGTRQGSACVEVILEVKTSTSKVTGSEDCLFLNVYSVTKPSTAKELKPVMVFIHGGGFVLGSSDIQVFGPDFLLPKDVIVVTLNYRLGVFGFLSTGDLAATGNYGLKDQNLALRWVQKNIRYFGGDPNNILLFGHSAGSVSVHFHMLSPKSRGLFHKIILESGSVLCLWGSQKKPRNQAYLLGLANGITNPRNNVELVEKLRALDTEVIKQSFLSVILAGLSQTLFTGFPWAPSLEVDHEDAFLSRDKWFDILKNGDFNHVPVIMGTNSNESVYFLQEFQTLQPILGLLEREGTIFTPIAMNIKDEQTSKNVGELIRKRYFGTNGRILTANILEVMRYVSEEGFVRPLWKTAQLMSQHIPLYFYHFRYESELGRLGLGEGREYPGVRGVAHEEEVHFIFNKMDNSSKKRTDLEVSNLMVTLWTNFAKYSNPTPLATRGRDGLNGIVWPKFSSNNRSGFIEIDKDLSIRDKPDEYENILWWDDLFNKYGKPPYTTY